MIPFCCEIITQPMEDSDERKSFQSEYESDADGPSLLRWTARRIEASDDDDSFDFEGEVVKRKFRWGSLCDESESECNGEPEYFEGGVVVMGEELEQVSQKEKEEEIHETVRIVKGEENKVMSPYFVPKHGFFYMHDDRFQSNRRYGRRRGSMIPKNGWDWTDEQKWKHDKFEDITDNNAPKNHHQHKRENRSKGQRYENKDLLVMV
ncbi:putative Btz domain-containing protein [Lupinus albus]|uniref:Putative Btz domain-containing protein n=1 Tax=Lupinus albus TaxID=3870 RepID=A0A6A4QHP0_LUPAL|nr:putative Btz domain-containing protein [Lupinus albus]